MDSSLVSLKPNLRPSFRQLFPRFSAITSVAIFSFAEKGEEHINRLNIKHFSDVGKVSTLRYF